MRATRSSLRALVIGTSLCAAAGTLQTAVADQGIAGSVSAVLEPAWMSPAAEHSASDFEALLYTSFAEQDDVRILHLLEISGVGHALEIMPAAMTDAFAHALEIEDDHALDARQQRELLEVVEAAFADVIDGKLLERAVHDNLDRAEQLDMIAFYESKFGQRVVALEHQRQQQPQDDYDTWLRQNPLSAMDDQRQRALMDLERSSHASQNVFEATLAIQLALKIGRLQSEGGDAVRIDARTLMEEVRRDMLFLHGFFEREALAWLAWLYRDLETEELSLLSAAYESSAGRAWIDTLGSSFGELQFRAGRRIGAWMGALSGQQEEVASRKEHVTI
ncbi:MAG: hypothetical protein CSB44_04215 [Gammaproteobacteria bacterium]|nr:MAG: hypothetical protein CSB44_04215 [Gammaproteobacteria bacterium]